MAIFEEEIDKLIKREGGNKLTNRVVDAGGITRYGVTDRLARHYDYTAKTLTRQQAVFIYRMHFWDAINLNEVESQKIAGKIFDISVNCGQSVGGRYLQKSLNVLNREENSWKELKVDGKIGIKTINVINLAVKSRPYMEGNIFKMLNILQGYKYYNLALNPKRRDEMNINGWLNNRID